MPIWIQKMTPSGGQYRLTLTKDLIKEMGFEKVRVVEITKLGKSAIKIEEYHAKKRRKARVTGHSAKTD